MSRLITTTPDQPVLSDWQREQMDPGLSPYDQRELWASQSRFDLSDPHWTRRLERELLKSAAALAVLVPCAWLIMGAF